MVCTLIVITQWSVSTAADCVIFNNLLSAGKGAGKQTGAIGGVMLSPENQAFQPRRSHTTAPTLSVASNQPRRSSARYSNRSDASLLPKAKDKWK